VGEPAGDGGLVAGAFQVRRDRLVAARPRQVRPAIEYAILGVNGFGIVVGAGIGGRRMAGDKIIDFQPILDGANALFERAVLADDNGSLKCDAALLWPSRDRAVSWP